MHTTRLLRLVAPLAPLLVLAGCPAAQEGDAAAYQGTLNLRLAQEVPDVGVGESAKLQLSFVPGQSDQHAYLFGAMIAGQQTQRVTHWHASPEGAVTFDGGTLTATFQTAGPVTIWATWEGDDGAEFRSNELVLNVRKDG